MSMSNTSWKEARLDWLLRRLEEIRLRQWPWPQLKRVEQVGNTVAENTKQSAQSHGSQSGSPVNSLSFTWELARDAVLGALPPWFFKNIYIY